MTPDAPALDEHIDFLIEHDPGNSILRWVPTADCAAPVYQRRRERFLRHVECGTSNARVLEHAVHFLLGREPGRVGDLIEHGERLEPDAATWPRLRGWWLDAMANAGRHDGASRDHQLACALAYAQTAERSASPGGRTFYAALAARAYLDAGEVERAAEHARANVDRLGAACAPRDAYSWHCTQAVLGRLVLRAGDVAAAADHLLAAGHLTLEIDAAPFRPDVQLANDLLAVGERDAVIAYLLACRAWSSASAPELAALATAVAEDGIRILPAWPRRERRSS